MLSTNYSTFLVESVSEKLLSLSANAIERICLLLSNDSSYFALRIFVTSGGCAGINYKMSIVEDFCQQDDLITHKILIKRFDTIVKKFVIVQKKSVLFLSGMLIDYVEEDVGGGFLFNNPNSKGSCGCGKSFSV